MQNDLGKDNVSFAQKHPHDLIKRGGHGCWDEVQGLRLMG